jgi:hypothetical protein
MNNILIFRPNCSHQNDYRYIHYINPDDDLNFIDILYIEMFRVAFLLLFIRTSGVDIIHVESLLCRSNVCDKDSLC